MPAYCWKKYYHSSLTIVPVGLSGSTITQTYEQIENVHDSLLVNFVVFPIKAKECLEQNL